MKKVTQAQVNRLYEFTRQHYVEYYDIQTELVDHLANAIEAHWEENPELDFEELLQKEFKKFGIFGFMDVVEKRQVAMTKHYHKLVWKEIKSFLKLPKVILTAALAWVAFFVISTFFYGFYILLGLVVLASLISFIYSIKHQRCLKRKIKTNHKRYYLLEEILNTYGGSGAVLFIPVHLFNIFRLESLLHDFWLQLIITAVFVAVSLYAYVVNYVLFQKREQILQQMYPELKWV